MSRVFNGSTDFLSVSDTVALGDFPLTLVAFVKRAAASGNREFVGGPVVIGDSNHRIGLTFEADNTVGALCRGAIDQVATAGAVTDTNWHLVVGRFGGTNSRFAALDGALGSENTSSAGPDFTTMNDFRVGRSGSGATPLEFAGKIASFAVFNYQLSQGDIDDLVSGAETPLTLTVPATHFWDFAGSSLADTGSVGGLTLTATGTTVDAADNPFGSAPTISDVGDQSFRVGETGVIITGTGFGATQGGGFVRVCPSNDVSDVNGVNLTVTAWGDTGITVDIPHPLASIPRNTNVYLFVKNDGALSNASGHVIQITPPPAVLAYAAGIFG